MLRVFVGSDPRQPIAYSVLQHSISVRSSAPVSITRLQLDQLPLEREGLTQFTYSRFLVPYLSGYEGVSLFLDADMLCLGDIAELFEYANSPYPVHVVKNKERFEWSSLMLFNNEHCKVLTPEFVATDKKILSMRWASVGDLPESWNHCVGYDPPQDAQLIHYTQGIPVWPQTCNCEYAQEWHDERIAMMSTCSFEELMGPSRHPVAQKERDAHPGN